MPDHLSPLGTANILKGARTFPTSVGSFSTPRDYPIGLGYAVERIQTHRWSMLYEASRVIFGYHSAPLRISIVAMLKRPRQSWETRDYPCCRSPFPLHIGDSLMAREHYTVVRELRLVDVHQAAWCLVPQMVGLTPVDGSRQ